MNKKPTNWIQGMSSTKKQLHHPMVEIDPDLFQMKIVTKRRKMVGEKLLRLRARIEDWASLNGYENMGNWSERKNSEGEVVWRKSHWEWVDDCYGVIINGYEFSWGKEQYKKFNDMWKQYEIDVHVVRPDNPNFDADWEQLQQMEWDEVGDEVSLGHGTKQ
jgi:hypothetical protein